MDKYAVFGNPIAHSKSPQIHTLFARQTGQVLEYSRQLVPVGEFDKAVDDFFNSGGKGLNITLPFKSDAYHYVCARNPELQPLKTEANGSNAVPGDQVLANAPARLTPRARQAGAVNTLAVQADGSLLGDNTDGAGLVSDLVENLGWTVSGKNLLVLGAGGAVRGCLPPLLEQRPARLVVANRTLDKGLQLAGEFADMGCIQACGYEDLAAATGAVPSAFDLIINGTSTGLSGELPPLPADLLTGESRCYDMMYAAEPTVFLKWARACGCRHLADGLGMLVAQAAESFYLWRGVKPAIRGIIEQLRAQL